MELGTLPYTPGMAVQPQPVAISVSRHVILLVLAILAFAIGAFLEFAKIAVQINVIWGLLFLGLALFAGSFL